MITDQSTDREYRRMPCEVYITLTCKDLSAATLVLIYYALLCTAALGSDVHPGRHIYDEFPSAGLCKL